jgi:PPOX class probable F420-dependent enzyme
MAEMSPEEIRAFLDRVWPTPLGVVATIRPDGSPHLVPVWYRFDSHVVHIWTPQQRLWVKNLMRDSRVAFPVQEERPPFAAVLLRGRAEVVTGDDDETSAEIRHITARYIAAPDVASYIQGWAGLRTIVRIHPTKITSWSRGY